jgi:hypothetical protein
MRSARVVPAAIAAWLVCWGAWAGNIGRASAEEPGEPDTKAGEVFVEQADPTRLDVARLPPEAIRITRDLYAHGFFVEAQLGAQGFVGDLGDVSNAGPRLSLNFGYELTQWFSLLIQGDAAFHNTKNRPPPSHTMYEMLGASAGARFSIPFNARAALWLDGLFGIVWTGGDVLHALGFSQSVGPSIAYGGELGFDWHVLARHHSFGLLAGAKALPDLARSSFSLALYGSVYLRYVF